MNSTLLKRKTTTPRIEPIPPTSAYLKWSQRLSQTHPIDSKFLEAFASIRRLLPRDGMGANPEAVKEIKTIMWEQNFENRCTREGNFLEAINN